MRHGFAIAQTGLGKHTVSFSIAWIILLVDFKNLTVSLKGAVIVEQTSLRHFRNFP